MRETSQAGRRRFDPGRPLAVARARRGKVVIPKPLAMSLGLARHPWIAIRRSARE
jgi:hypothetical protein